VAQPTKGKQFGRQQEGEDHKKPSKQTLVPLVTPDLSGYKHFVTPALKNLLCHCGLETKKFQFCEKNATTTKTWSSKAVSQRLVPLSFFCVCAVFHGGNFLGTSLFSTQLQSYRVAAVAAVAVACV